MQTLNWHEQEDLFNNLYGKRDELKNLFGANELHIVNLEKLIEIKREEIKEILVTLDVYIEQYEALPIKKFRKDSTG